MKYGRLNASIRSRLESKPMLSSDIRNVAKEIGKGHEWATDLWTAKSTNHRLAV